MPDADSSDDAIVRILPALMAYFADEGSSSALNEQTMKVKISMDIIEIVCFIFGNLSMCKPSDVFYFPRLKVGRPGRLALARNPSILCPLFFFQAYPFPPQLVGDAAMVRLYQEGKLV